MFGNRLTPAELGIAVGNYVLHAGDIFKDLGGQLRDGSAPREDALRRFASGRKVSQPKNSAALPALASPVGACSGFSRQQTPLAIFDRTAVGEVKVVQYFRRTPFALGMAREVFS